MCTRSNWFVAYRSTASTHVNGCSSRCSSTTRCCKLALSTCSDRAPSWASCSKSTRHTFPSRCRSLSITISTAWRCSTSIPCAFVLRFRHIANTRHLNTTLIQLLLLARHFRQPNHVSGCIATLPSNCCSMQHWRSSANQPVSWRLIHRSRVCCTRDHDHHARVPSFTHVVCVCVCVYAQIFSISSKRQHHRNPQAIQV
jgi:hypothetical protein